VSRGREFFYFQAGRGTSAEGPRIRLPDDPHKPEFWTALRTAQGKSNVEADNTVNGAIDGYLAAATGRVGEETLYNYGRSSASRARRGGRCRSLASGHRMFWRL
jgi:hypothetical protein